MFNYQKCFSAFCHCYNIWREIHILWYTCIYNPLLSCVGKTCEFNGTLDFKKKRLFWLGLIISSEPLKWTFVKNRNSTWRKFSAAGFESGGCQEMSTRSWEPPVANSQGEWMLPTNMWAGKKNLSSRWECSPADTLISAS